MIKLKQVERKTWYAPENGPDTYEYGEPFYVNPSSIDVITPTSITKDGRKVLRVWVGQIWHDVFEDDLSSIIDVESDES